MATHSRRMTSRLLLWLNVAAANLAAVVCVIGFLGPGTVGAELPVTIDKRHTVLMLDTGTAWIVFLGALVLLCFNLWWLLRRPATTPAPTHVVSESPGGLLRISRDALEAGLRTAGEALPEITRVRVTVDPGNPRRVVVRGHFQCPEGVSNLQASQRLRAALQDRFAGMVRLPEGVRAEFEIEFLGFVGKLSKKAVEGEALAREEPPPFTGPRYPIEEEETSGGMM